MHASIVRTQRSRHYQQVFFTQQSKVFAFKEFQGVFLQARLASLQILEHTSRGIAVIEKSIVEVEQECFDFSCKLHE